MKIKNITLKLNNDNHIIDEKSNFNNKEIEYKN